MVNNSSDTVQLLNNRNSLYMKCGRVDSKAHLDKFIIHVPQEGMET